MITLDKAELKKTYPEGYKIPEGYEVIGFRLPEVGESFILSNFKFGGDDEIGVAPGSILYCPRLIVRPITCTVTPKDVYPLGYEIPTGYEFERFGLPREGEWYLPTIVGQRVNRCEQARSALFSPRIILKRQRSRRWVVEVSNDCTSYAPVNLPGALKFVRDVTDEEGV